MCKSNINMAFLRMPIKLLASIVLLMISSVDIIAQTTVQIGSGTLSPPATLYGPLYRFSATSTTTGCRSDMLWTAAEMASAGIPAGAQITKVEFNKTSTANFTSNITSFDMLVANTSNTTLATTLTWASILTSHTNVFSAAGYNLPATAGWVSWTFNAPFTYTGGAFEIATEHVKGATGSTSFIPWEYTAGTASMIVGNASATGATLNGGVAAYKFRPNIKITFTSGGCTSPPTAGTSLAVPSSGLCVGNSIALNLSGNSIGSGQSYQWESATSIGGPYSSVGSSSSSPSLNITATSTLYYRCAVECGGNTQYSTPVLVTVNPPFPSGSYTINSGVATGGTNFQSFTDLKNALSCGIAGPIIVDVVSGSGPYNEQVEFPVIGGASPTNTITINGNGNTLTFAATVSTAPGTLILNGTDYMNFNDLVISGTGATYALSCHLWNQADNNTFTNCTFNAPETGTATTLSPFSVSGSATAATTAGVSGNNIVVTNCTMNGGYYCAAFSSPASSSFSGNQLNNCTIQNFYAYGSYNLNQNGTIISGNTIQRPTRVGFTTFYGVYVSSCSNLLVEKNKIRKPFESDISLTTLGYGVYLTGDASVGNENNIVNNLVSDFNGNGAHYGIYSTGADYWKAYHNTFSFDHTSSTATGITYGVYSSGTLAFDVRNNIISITRGGTGIKYGLYFTTPAAATSNYNDVYVNSASGTNNFGYNGTAQASILDWQTATSQDLNSLDLIPTFVNPGTGDYSQGNGFIFDMGTPLGILTDINGVTRSVTNPDLGAYEVGGGDIVPPMISFTNIPSSICTTDPTLFANITDLSGVNTTTHLPRIWFKKSTESNAYNGNTSADNGWKYAVALNTSSPFQFSIPYGLLNSTLVAGDIVQYFVSAEDLAPLPNAGIQSGTFPIGYIPTSADLDVNAFPIGGTIKSFTILPDPVTVNSVSSESTLCLSGTTTLSLSGDVSTGAFYQWQSSPTGANTWSDIAGATSATFTTSTFTSSTDFRCEISCGDLVANGGSPITINNSVPVTVTVNNPTIASTVPASRCGTGTVTLSATASGSGTVKWYTALTGGNSVSTGSSFTTPTISSTTTYYASASEGGGTGLLGPLSPSIGTGANSTIAIGTQQLFFDVISTTTIISVDVYPTAAIGSSFTLQIQNSAGTPIWTSSPILTTVTGGSTPQTVALNAPIPVGTGYRMGFTVNPGMIRNSTGGVYPYSSSTLNITGNSFDPVYYYFFYNWVISTGCESARVPVIATVTAADPVTISGSGTVECNDAYVALDVTSPLANYDSYIWSPTTNLYADNLGTPYAGGSASTVYVKSSIAGATTYTLNATNSISGCANTVSGATTFLPGASLSISGNSDICISGSKTLSLSPTTGLSASNIQWNMNGNPISGANSLTYATGTLTTTTSYSADLIDGNANVCLTTPTADVLVNNPVITGTTPGSRCGAGTVNLSASATAVNSAPTYNWYSAASGGSPLYSGPLNTFTTPVITATTDFYVSASEGGGGGANVGKTSLSSGQTQNTGTAAYMIFSAFSNFTLNTIKVYPYGTVDNVPGTMTISIANSSGTVLQSATVNVIANLATNPNPQVVPVNFAITPGTDYRILFTGYSGGVSGALRDLTSASPAPVFPYTIPGVVSITNSSIAGYYYYFYDWNVSTACESARQAVTATVNSSPAINVTTSSSTTCVGNQVQLEVTSTNPDYTYSWTSTPSGFTASGAGPFNATIGANTTYNVTAIDNTTGTYAGCGALGSTTVTSVPNLLSLSVNATPATVCSGSNSQLEAVATIPTSGYTMNASCTTSFVDISTTGTSVGTLGDDLEYNVTIPSFTYNGVAYTSIRLGTNGVIAFGATTGDVPTGNAALPATTITAGNNFLAPYWDDLDVNLGGTIKTETVGNTFIIQYTNIDHNLFTTGGITFQVQLDLTTGVISYVYQDVVFGSATYDNGLTATVGLQNGATSALQHSFNTASLTNGQSICFTPIPTTPTVTYDWTANSTYLSATNIANPIATAVTSNQTYTVVVTDASGCTKSATKLVDIVNCSSTLNLTLFLQGYYTGSNTMQEVMANQGYLPTPATGDCDDITVELHDATTTTTIAGTTTARLHADGTASAVFTPGVTGNYYVVIKHRNSIQTWSTDPVTLSSTTSYNFSTAATQAYADNMVEVETGVWAIYTGDLNQDDFIDSFDFPIFDLDATNGVAGVYVATDMNGDGFVDPFDFPVFDVNSFNGVLAVYP